MRTLIKALALIHLTSATFTAMTNLLPSSSSNYDCNGRIGCNNAYKSLDNDFGTSWRAGLSNAGHTMVINLGSAVMVGTIWLTLNTDSDEYHSVYAGLSSNYNDNH